jgi:hypothetical protein
MRLIVIAFLLLFASKSRCQTELSLNSNYGWLMAHRKEMHRITQGHSYGFNIQVGNEVNGEKEWHKLYLMPETGFCFSYLNLGNNQELGNAYGFFIQMRLPVSRNNNWMQGFSLGTGIGYLNKPFNIDENRFNTAIGSKINAGIFLEYQFKYALSKNLIADLGLRMTHYSNGAYQIPNLGVNIPGICIGLTYREGTYKGFGENPEKYKLQERTKRETQLVLIGAMRESFPATGPKYGVLGMGMSENFRISDKSSLLLGAEYFYNASMRKQLKEFKGIEAKNSDLQSFGISAGYGMHFGDMFLLFQMGHYLADEHLVNGPWYHRVGMRHKIKGHLLGTINLKTHFAKADYFEFGLGWNL